MEKTSPYHYLPSIRNAMHWYPCYRKLTSSVIQLSGFDWMVTTLVLRNVYSYRNHTELSLLHLHGEHWSPETAS